MDLSYSWLKLLLSNPHKRAKGYLYQQRDKEFISAYVIGSAVHKIIDEYNNYWIINPNIWYELYENECERYNILESIKDKEAILCATESYFSTNPTQYLCSEIMLTTKHKGIILKWIIDILDWDTIIDLKVVSQFTDNENDYHNTIARYTGQAIFYANIYYKIHNKMPKVIFREILKTNKSYQYTKKDDLIAMCKDFKEEDSKLTKEKIVEKYRLQPEVVKDIEIKVTQENIKKMDEVIDSSLDIIEYYKSIPLEKIPQPLDSIQF